ncbi:OprD family porin [Stutzerimonas azotifigens]|uniref:OprD family porin n=1 Tax=Stutzerimonas azotifigens TaxID=291995 RepID=UPI00047F618F|nr:OprD family porin [Stutzerimonas azotifigens]
MLKTPIARGVALATLGASMAVPSMAQAAFFEDSKASLELRNFYFNSDNHQSGASQSKSDEWAQGFILNFESGFTEGPIGFGVDALGLLGVKLDSSPDRTGSGLLPAGSDGYAPDEYGRLNGAAKVRVSKTVLKVGDLIPKLPTILPSDSRLLPQTFRGGMLTSQEIEGLTFVAGRLTDNSLRNDASYEDIAMASATGATGLTPTDKFDFASLKYKWNDQLTTSYDFGKLHDNYKQHIVNLVHVLPLGDKQSFKSDIRYAHSTDDGNSNVDSKAFGAMFTYSLGGHAFGAAYQDLSGDTAYPYLAGGDAFLVNYVMIDATFADPEEKSWQLRYDYNFAAMGIPGLTFMTRYIKGTDTGLNGNGGDEWERDTDIGYVVQTGALKNLGLKWRNGTYRGDNREIDQNRLIVSYTIPLL